MKSSPKPSVLVIAAFVALLLGITNYFLFRPQIVLFRWLGVDSAKSILINHKELALFLRGYFSDIAWCVALCLITVALDTCKKLRTIDKFLILSLPFASEFAQYFSLIPGTFDRLDLLTYLVIILTFSIIFPSKLIPVHIQKVNSHIWGLSVFILFLYMVLASATPRRTTYQKPNDPCVRHAALTYSPILVQINITGSYTMKDLAGAQTSGQTYFMQALSATSYNKYQLAQGVTPNLNIYITVNNDGYQHYGARVTFYVYDDNTWFDMTSNYVDPYKLFDDIATKLNTWMIDGWFHGDCK
jgi:hypothetical protein